MILIMAMRRAMRKREDTTTSSVNDSTNDDSDNRRMYLTNSFWLVRILFIRSLGLIYFVAFLVALNQNKELIGSNGLLPLSLYLKRIKSSFKTSPSPLQLLATVPTIFWSIPGEYIDNTLDMLATIGLILSLALIITGGGNAIIFFILWCLYQSISNVGQRWYSFGWESQLLEVGFLSIFMCPLFHMERYPRHTPTSWVTVWGNRWMIFRIMIGAGLIKLRGDICWRDLTCMNYHYETQPVPNPLSFYLHHNPEIIHKMETLGNHIIELIVPFFIFLPQPFCAINGYLQILFQFVLIASGNLSFLNWLTMLPSIFCFDDYRVAWIFSKSSVDKAIQLQKETSDVIRPKGFFIRKVMMVFVGLLLAYLSIPVIQNLLSSRQQMNTSFDPLRIVNTYGAFGSVTKTRTEVILEGTYDTQFGKDGEGAHWQELEFNCKPGKLSRRPCLISPYHYRLDWLMWFAAFQNYQYNPWLIHVCAKLLSGDPSLNSLIAYNPFIKKPPKYVRAVHYRYEFTKIGSVEGNRGEWWKREKIGVYIPVVDRESLETIMKEQGSITIITTCTLCEILKAVTPVPHTNLKICKSIIYDCQPVDPLIDLSTAI